MMYEMVSVAVPLPPMMPPLTNSAGEVFQAPLMMDIAILIVTDKYGEQWVWWPNDQSLFFHQTPI